MAGTRERLTGDTPERTWERWQQDGVPGKNVVPFIVEWADLTTRAVSRAQPLLTPLALRVVGIFEKRGISEEQRIECLQLAVKLMTISDRRGALFGLLKALVEELAREPDAKPRKRRPSVTPSTEEAE